MATNNPGRRRLILCGVCFRADCPWSKWIDEDGNFLAAEDFLAEMRDEFFGRIHSEFEEKQATKLTVEQRQELIAETIEEIGADVEISNLNELLGKASNLETEHRLETEKDFSVDDILKKFQETVERPKDDNNKRQHEN